VNVGGSRVAEPALQQIGSGFLLERHPFESAAVGGDADVVLAGRRAVLVVIGGQRKFSVLIGRAGGAWPIWIGFRGRLENDQGADDRTIVEENLTLDWKTPLAVEMAFSARSGKSQYRNSDGQRGKPAHTLPGAEALLLANHHEAGGALAGVRKIMSEIRRHKEALLHADQSDQSLGVRADCEKLH